MNGNDFGYHIKDGNPIVNGIVIKNKIPHSGIGYRAGTGEQGWRGGEIDCVAGAVTFKQAGHTVVIVVEIDCIEDRVTVRVLSVDDGGQAQ